MKKAILIIILGLFWCNVGFAELINFKKCFQRNETFKDNKFKDGSYYQDKHTWSVNLSTSKITNIIKYKKYYKDKYDYKDLYWDFDLHNFTDNLIVARTYAYNTPDNTWLENQNDRSVISYEVFIDLKNKEVTIKRFPNGTRGLSLKNIGYIAKLNNITFKEAIDEYVGYYHDIYICEEVEGLGGKEIDSEPQDLDIDDNEIISASSGSGFFVSKEGHIVTNFHVIEDCDSIKVHFKGKEVESEIFAFDKMNDLAIIQANINPLKVFSVSDKDVTLLQDVIVAGYPLGKNVSSAIKMHKGSITALAGYEDNYSNFQTDATINQGNSGGPIIDKYGNVVGIAVATWVEEGVQGIHFGIKSSVLRTFANAKELNFSPPTYKEMPKEKLGKLISEATTYLECWMTGAKIKKMIAEANNKKAFYSKFNQ